MPKGQADDDDDDDDDVRTNFGALLYDKVSSQGRFTPLDIVGAAISFIY